MLRLHPLFTCELTTQRSVTSRQSEKERPPKLHFSSSPLQDSSSTDRFVRTVSRPIVQFGTHSPVGMNTSSGFENAPSLLEILDRLGNPVRGLLKDVRDPKTSQVTNRHVGLSISKYFTPSEQEENISYEELLQAIRTMAQGYRELGLNSGDKIALAETNSLDFFSSYFGGLAMGATMGPINLLALQDKSTKASRLGHMLSTPLIDSQDTPGVDAFVIGKDKLFDPMHKLEKILTLTRHATVRKLLGPTIERFVSGQPARGLQKLIYKALAKNAKTEQERQDLLTFFQNLPPRMRLVTPEQKLKLIATPTNNATMLTQPRREQVADILYTSGTSGHPKGVALTHGNLSFTVQSLTEATKSFIGKNDVILLGLPLFHIFGKAVMLTALSRQLDLATENPTNPGTLKTVLLPSLTRAMELAVDETTHQVKLTTEGKPVYKNMDKVVRTIAENRVTVLPAVPKFLEALVEHIHQNPEEMPLLKTIRTIVSGGDPLKWETFEALHQMIPGVRVMDGYGTSEAGIVLLNTQGTYGYVGFPLPGVEVKIDPSGNDPNEGELLVRSPGVTQGYVPGTVDAEASTETKDPDGWYRTGDIVRFDPMNGYKIIGRESFFIKIAGEKRDPRELEEAIQLADSRVLDAMAVSHNPGTTDEKAVALVVSPDPAVTEASIKQAMSTLVADGRLAGWKISKHIVVLHQAKMPARFDNGFKRDAGYKLVRQFFKEALKPQNGNPPALALRDKSPDGQRERTEIVNHDAFSALVNKYNTSDI